GPREEVEADSADLQQTAQSAGRARDLLPDRQRSPGFGHGLLERRPVRPRQGEDLHFREGAQAIRADEDPLAGLQFPARRVSHLEAAPRVPVDRELQGPPPGARRCRAARAQVAGDLPEIHAGPAEGEPGVEHRVFPPCPSVRRPRGAGRTGILGRNPRERGRKGYSRSWEARWQVGRVLTMKSLIAILALLMAPADETLAPWGANKHATDTPKQHKEEVTGAKQAYTVTQGGTMDGRNCRSPLGVGMSREGAIEQTWESNRAVRMENVGDTDVVNPWLSNGQNNLRTFEEIIAASTAPGMTDAEKAMGLWWHRIKYRYHFGGADGSEEGDLVKVFHIYGYNTCGSDSMMMAGLWKQVGLKAAPARGVGHCISQVFYDGKWHLYDGDMKSVFLSRDNETVAGEQDIVRDHDLIKRTHSQGILQPINRGSEEWMAAIYGFEGEVKGQRDCYRDGTLKMTLRPGEALVWRWGHLTPARFNGGGQALYPDTICNGLWEYRPDFSKELWRKGAVVEGVKS